MKFDFFLLSIFRYIGKKPNTYTFTKCLAEHVVWDHRHVLPIVIFRPSIGECLKNDYFILFYSILEGQLNLNGSSYQSIYSMGPNF